MVDPGDPKGIRPKVLRGPVFSTNDITDIRECITFYLNRNDFLLEANTQNNFRPTDNNAAKRERLLRIIHRLGRLDNV